MKKKTTRFKYWPGMLSTESVDPKVHIYFRKIALYWIHIAGRHLYLSNMFMFFPTGHRADQPDIVILLPSTVIDGPSGFADRSSSSPVSIGDVMTTTSIGSGSVRFFNSPCTFSFGSLTYRSAGRFRAGNGILRLFQFHSATDVQYRSFRDESDVL